MKIAAGVGEVVEEAREGSKMGAVTFNGQAGDRVGEEAKIFGHFSAGEAEEERVVVRDNLKDTFERNRFSETKNVVVGEGVP